MLLLFFVVAIIGCEVEEENRTMSEPKNSPTPEVVAFHECVKSGSLEELKLALESGADVNAPGEQQKTALMKAIDAKDVEKMKLLVDHGADPELTDEFNTTALGHAVSWDFAEGVAYLLSLDVDLGYHPKYPLKKLDLGFGRPGLELSEDLKEGFTEEEWEEFKENIREMIPERELNPTIEPIISHVHSVEVLKLFLQAGDELSLASKEMKQTYLGLSDGGKFQSSFADFRKYRAPRFGSRNPELMSNPFWEDMIRLGGNAYSARKHFQDMDLDSKRGAVWCNDRFGASLTQLEDGRFVQIGGEHEDFYDPDFYIYNDVVIFDGKGEIKIYGYPRDVFPPTDFHTATLSGDSIFIIGCLGYPELRELGRTPVYRLRLETWKIEVIKTSGEMPSWIHKHRSSYDKQNNVVRIEGGDLLTTGSKNEQDLISNSERYELNLSSFHWSRIK